MNEQKKQKLLEQYDDAAFALLMDEYAEEEGARLMAEFEAAQAAGQVPQMPAELDEQCRRMIRRDRAKKRGKQAARSFRKVAVKAAVAVLVFIGLMTTVVLSVDALRVPVLNYFIQLSETSGIIDFGNAHSKQPTSDSFPHDLIPDGYTEVHSELKNGLPTCMYANAEGFLILFDITHSHGKFAFDTDDAIVEEIVFNDCVAFYICKNTTLQLIWFDEDNQFTYSCTCDGLTEDDFFSFCNAIADRYMDISN